MRIRNNQLERLRTSPDVSVLIIGAGINGIGTFRDLALQGVDVLLVDRGDFCSGASAASSHMVHGGIRYLENGEFRLVREALQERNRLLNNAPHYVRPLPTVIPIFRWFSGLLNAPLKFLNVLDRPAERGAVVIKAGLIMYDAYTGSDATVPNHEFRLRGESLGRFPELNPEIVCTAMYYDASMNAPERICIELVTDALSENDKALAFNYMSVTGAEGEEVVLRDEMGGETLRVRPTVVINAAGPWIDFANRELGLDTHFIGGTKGSHLILDNPELRGAIGEHEFFFENEDGRIVLIYPFGERVMIGTSDIPIADPDDAVCTDQEVSYFLEMVERVFPGIPVERSQIVYTFSGVRPLPYQDAATPGQISRDHSVKVVEPNEQVQFPILNLVGGKWTTFRAFAEGVTDRALSLLGRERNCSTVARPIGGGRGYPESAAQQRGWLRERSEKFDIEMERLETLFGRYGTRAEDLLASSRQRDTTDQPLENLPSFSRHELLFLAEREAVVHLDDLLMRRSLLAMLGQVTLPRVQEIAEVIAPALDWSGETVGNEVRRFVELLERENRVLLQSDDQQPVYRARSTETYGATPAAG